MFPVLSGLQTIFMFLSITNEILNFAREFLQHAEDELEFGKRMTIVKLMVYGYAFRFFSPSDFWVDPDKITDLKHRKNYSSFFRRTHALLGALA